MPEGNSKLYAFSEISPGNKIKVFVNTSIGVNTEDDFIFPKQSDAEVALFQDDVKLENPGFRYIASEKAFVSQGAFRPEQGVSYSLSVRLKNDHSIAPIMGTTVIPMQEEFQGVNFSEFQEKIDAAGLSHINFNADFDFGALENKCFIIRPMVKDARGASHSLLVRRIVAGNNGAKYSRHNDGILVNTAKSGNRLALQLESINGLNLIKGIEQIDFEVVSLTEDAYNYYKAYSNQVFSQSFAISEPVVSYSNFENGLGLFAGCITTMMSFPFE